MSGERSGETRLVLLINFTYTENSQELTKVPPRISPAAFPLGYTSYCKQEDRQDKSPSQSYLVEVIPRPFDYRKYPPALQVPNKDDETERKYEPSNVARKCESAEENEARDPDDTHEAHCS